MDALSAIRSAERLDPRSLSVRSAAAMVVFFDEKFEDGLINVEKALEIDPKFVPALKVKRWILTAKNDHAGAHAVVEPERLFSGGSKSDPSWDIIEAQVADPVEQRAEALAMLARAANADTIRSNDKAFAFDIALAFNHLGEKQRALDYLERAEKAGSHSFNLMDADPRLKGLRTEARYLRLLEKLSPQD